MKKIFFRLEVVGDYPPVSMESIWAEPTKEGFFKIDNIPFYSKEVSLGDIVSAEKQEENYFLYRKTIVHSNNSTIRIIFFNDDQELKDQVLARLTELGCSFEAFDEKFYAINVPITVDIELIYNFLDSLLENEELDYETGYLSQ
ncbi:MAG: DUF4265 domain-containing protein [Neisseria sp.]|uniref:DUF4265 domain-containing protein n=1 Tax=Neisseria sp. TaxID=192066 RepID=UPI0026DB9706|nr:DUF4265 domain-containing protein [Neisseria sp.]MDO4640114.1 DUF4265 domain-containing protein [Neisseria sp.]